MNEFNPDLAKILFNLLTMARAAAESRPVTPETSTFDVLLRQAKDHALEFTAGVLASRFVTITSATLSGLYQAEANA